MSEASPPPDPPCAPRPRRPDHCSSPTAPASTAQSPEGRQRPQAAGGLPRVLPLSSRVCSNRSRPGAEATLVSRSPQAGSLRPGRRGSASGGTGFLRTAQPALVSSYRQPHPHGLTETRSPPTRSHWGVGLQQMNPRGHRQPLHLLSWASLRQKPQCPGARDRARGWPGRSYCVCSVSCRL